MISKDREALRQAIERRRQYDPDLIISLERKGMSRWYLIGTSSRLFDTSRIKKRRF